jgi:hypothetical protein
VYHIDEDAISLDDLKHRIVATDLVPSRACLLDDIDARFSSLKRSGCLTLGHLRMQLRNRKSISHFTKQTGIDSQYLILLRREIESYFPKTFPIDSFDWIDDAERAALKAQGLKDTRRIYEALHSPERGDVLGCGVSRETIEALASLTDLTRIQWTSPVAARMLLAAGYDGSQMVASADPERLCDDLDEANRRGQYFRGKIGLRDVKRLVQAASYLHRTT